MTKRKGGLERGGESRLDQAIVATRGEYARLLSRAGCTKDESAASTACLEQVLGGEAEGAWEAVGRVRSTLKRFQHAPGGVPKSAVPFYAREKPEPSAAGQGHGGLPKVEGMLYQRGRDRHQKGRGRRAGSEGKAGRDVGRQRGGREGRGRRSGRPTKRG